MPTIEIQATPEIFMLHKGIAVFRTYKDDDINQGHNTYRFTLDQYSDDNEFDIRYLNLPSTLKLTEGHPPYISDSNPQFSSATDKQKEQWRIEWDSWHNGGEEKVIKELIAEAIDLEMIDLSLAEQFVATDHDQQPKSDCHISDFPGLKLGVLHYLINESGQQFENPIQVLATISWNHNDRKVLAFNAKGEQLAELHHAHILWVDAGGIRFHGMQAVGQDAAQFRVQQWQFKM